MKVSKNFKLQELTAGVTADANGKKTPGVQEGVNLCALKHNALQPHRNCRGKLVHNQIHYAFI